jgi:hypothetical protein
VAGYASSLGAQTLIETGTLHGDMVYAMRRHFKRIISIELNESFCAEAQRRFERRSSIEIVHGDSGELLSAILRRVSGRCVIWLDGHYSGGATAKGGVETPILAELKSIFDYAPRNLAVLIDDARLFNGTHDYPTLEELRTFVAAQQPDFDFSVQYDVIRLHSKTAGLAPTASSSF